MKLPSRNPVVALSTGLILLSLLACTSTTAKNFRKDVRKFGPNQKSQKPRVEKAPQAPQGGYASSEAAAHKNGSKSELLEGRTPLELACDTGDAQACYDFARASLQVSTQDEVTTRAAMAMFRACDSEHPMACYEYALMSWLEVGTTRNIQELAFSMERARRLGDERSKESYEEMLRPARADAAPIKDTMLHYERACGMSLVPACVMLERLEGEPTAAARSGAKSDASPRLAPVAVAPRKIVVQDMGLSITGEREEGQLRAQLPGKRSQLEPCYQQGLARNPTLLGVAIINFSLEASGEVSSATLQGSTLAEPEALACMEDVVGEWEFEETANKNASQVVYMVEFKPR